MSEDEIIEYINEDPRFNNLSWEDYWKEEEGFLDSFNWDERVKLQDGDD